MPNQMPTEMRWMAFVLCACWPIALGALLLEAWMLLGAGRWFGAAAQLLFDLAVTAWVVRIGQAAWRGGWAA